MVALLLVLGDGCRYPYQLCGPIYNKNFQQYFTKKMNETNSETRIKSVLDRRRFLGLCISISTTGKLAARSWSQSSGLLDNPWCITENVGVGPINLGADISTTVEVLGAPESIFDFPGDPDYPAWPPKLFYKYLSQGFVVEIMKNKITAITLYTGQLAGYQTDEVREFQHFADTGLLRDLVDLQSLLATLGNPSRSYSMTFADIPCERLQYSERGLTFEFVADTGRLSSVEVKTAW